MRVAIATITAALCFSTAWGQDESTIADAPATLDEVLVTGEQAGPGLWKVTHPTADGEHTLWILGSYAPLPKKMTWRSQEVERVLAASQAVIATGSVTTDIGFFSRLALLPSLIGVRDNPDDKKLAEIVPAELYARWTTLKAKYLGRDRSVEKWRPIFAAQELYSAAIDDAGLASRGVVWSTVEKLAKKNDVKIVRPTVAVPINKPRAAIKEFKKSPLDDVECFAKTIERLETDLASMRALANAWAVGNVAALKSMAREEQIRVCIEAVMNTQMVQERGLQHVPGRMAVAWFDAVEKALRENASTLAVLSIDEIFKPDGYVAQLRGKGYRIEEP